MTPAIRIDRLSKRYRLGELGHHGTLGERLAALFRRRGNGNVGGADELWALKDVSFEVEPGEVVGIIGRNGAGKSTLLKILSRITEPTTGTVELRGRVSSLLEVGTGFHPELTGRENVYLNGSILGMRKAEIDRKFDAIVDFAGVERFLDTPVKRYSSGMQVRLAFAVAAHLEPEILIVDEVLAVGDAEFQRKCLGKMGEVAGGGRTVLFVSHNMAAVRQLCERVVVVDKGKIQLDGEPEATINAYLADADASLESRTEWTWPAEDAPGLPDICLRKVQLIGEHSRGPTFRPDEEVTIRIQYEQLRPLTRLRFVVRLLTMQGEVAFGTTDEDIRQGRLYSPGRYQTQCTIPRNLLNRRTYCLRIGLADQGILFRSDLGKLVIDGIRNDGSINGGPSTAGVVCPRIPWRIAPLDGSRGAEAGIAAEQGCR
ncbi:MAG TPA: ABC transporter ATP-binding protein [Afifellaceae bacterium]|nr:ABC transporter ATP-binding protein [Afifellaceae bacterium]